MSDKADSDKLEPSKISVGGVGKISKVTVTLNSLRHPHLNDLDLMPVGPRGQNALIMSDIGGDSGAGGVTVTLDDEAADLLARGGWASAARPPLRTSGGTSHTPLASC